MLPKTAKQTTQSVKNQINTPQKRGQNAGKKQTSKDGKIQKTDCQNTENQRKNEKKLPKNAKNAQKTIK
ncbi:MAG: hypothetical protein LBT04_06270 [Prevotellaceae bacterium]|jgi:hypothetical protein|nr:hypothetical protein [Prevotellaceae bacterium]